MPLRFSNVLNGAIAQAHVLRCVDPLLDIALGALHPALGLVQRRPTGSHALRRRGKLRVLAVILGCVLDFVDGLVNFVNRVMADIAAGSVFVELDVVPRGTQVRERV